MSSNVEGFEYENTVIAALKAAGYCGNITEGAGASAAAADADLKIGDDYYLVEVKKDAGAQMGGTSVRYVNGEFEVISNAVEEDTVEMIIEALKPRREAIDSLLHFVGGDQFPISCSKEAWTTAKVAGLLKPINTKIRKDTDFIANHYKKKGIHYIQVGGAGLFYLSENPANLPVPKLDGQIDIELRAGRSGSRLNLEGEKIVSGGLRAQGRLKFSGESPYTLDDPESVKALVLAWAAANWQKATSIHME